ncbi:MAG TPA: SIS domain-containing protein [Thermoanaerobaculaceae bacterium]|nr:SIS domain-containing protein [Thermoanaerobaculaceae bacterium]
MSLHSEIQEQPGVLARLLEEQGEAIRSVARAVRARGCAGVFLAARGSSDNAGLYAKYLWGSHNRLPVALAAPSLFTVYASPPIIKDMLVVGISQSGQSPDIVSVITEGRAQGALTLAITNDRSSPIAHAAEYVIDTCAGVESAVAATKSYTAQLMAVAMLSVALEEAPDRLRELGTVPKLVRDALLEEPAIEEIGERYRSMTRCVVLGRGYNFATAYEWALKLKELTHVAAEPYSSADFQHGPTAMVSPGLPVLAVAPEGAIFGDVMSLLKNLVSDLGAELTVISNVKEALSIASASLRLPAGVPEWLSPVVSVVPVQLFCYHLTRAKGFDTENPRRLSKVTRTW